MKNLIALAAVAILIAASVVTYSSLKASRQAEQKKQAAKEQADLYRGAIQMVMKQLKMAADESVTVTPAKHGTETKQFNQKAFGNAIGQISILKCPYEFQTAWINFQKAVNEANDYGLASAASDLLNAVGTVRGISRSNPNLSLAADQKALQETSAQLATVALKYLDANR